MRTKTTTQEYFYLHCCSAPTSCTTQWARSMKTPFKICHSSLTCQTRFKLKPLKCKILRVTLMRYLNSFHSSFGSSEISLSASSTNMATKLIVVSISIKRYRSKKVQATRSKLKIDCDGWFAHFLKKEIALPWSDQQKRKKTSRGWTLLTMDNCVLSSWAKWNL